MKLTLIILLLVISTDYSFTQALKIKNVHYRIIDEKIEIFYDLPFTNDSLNVQLVFRKKSDSKFIYYPQYIEGDVGQGLFSGTKKKIVWWYKKEPEYLFTGSEFYFKVIAVKIPKKEDIIRD